MYCRGSEKSARFARERSVEEKPPKATVKIAGVDRSRMAAKTD